MLQFSVLVLKKQQQKGVMINCKHNQHTYQLILELVAKLHGSLAVAPAVIKSNVNSVSITHLQQF